MTARAFTVFWGATAAAVILLGTTAAAWDRRADPASDAILALALVGLVVSLAVAGRIIWVTQRRRPGS